MPRFSGIPVKPSVDIPDPGYKYIPGTGLMCRPDKLDELTRKLNATNIESDRAATDEQIQEVIGSALGAGPS